MKAHYVYQRSALFYSRFTLPREITDEERRRNLGNYDHEGPEAAGISAPLARAPETWKVKRQMGKWRQWQRFIPHRPIWPAREAFWNPNLMGLNLVNYGHN